MSQYVFSNLRFHLLWNRSNAEYPIIFVRIIMINVDILDTLWGRVWGVGLIGWLTG